MKYFVIVISTLNNKVEYQACFDDCRCNRTLHEPAIFEESRCDLEGKCSGTKIVEVCFCLSLSEKKRISISNHIFTLPFISFCLSTSIIVFTNLLCCVITTILSIDSHSQIK